MQKVFHQKKNGDKYTFEFVDESIIYSVKTDSESSKTAIPYVDVTSNHWEYVKKNDWFKHVGLIWIAIGGFVSVQIMSDSGTFVPSMWLILGAVMLLVYKVRQTKFLVVEAGRSNILIIKDTQEEEIYDLLIAKRNEKVMGLYGAINKENTHEEELNKFKNLFSMGYMSQEKFEEIQKELLDHHMSKHKPEEKAEPVA